MGEVINLGELAPNEVEAYAAQVAEQDGLIEVIIHPFSLGWDDESVMAELDDIVSDDLGGACGLPRPKEEYCRRHQEYLGEARAVLETSATSTTVVLRDWESKNFVVWDPKARNQRVTPSRRFDELLRDAFPDRTWLIVQTERGWADPCLGWDWLTKTLQDLGARKLQVFGAIYSPAENLQGQQDTGRKACVNTAFDKLSLCDSFEVEVLEAACMGPL